MNMLYYRPFFILVGCIYEIRVAAQYIPHTICAQALRGVCKPACSPGENEVNSNFPDICRGTGGVCCNIAIGGQTWGPWSTWSSCSVTCGGGERTRKRTCASGICLGDNLQKQRCNRKQCLTVPLTWATWGSWSSCHGNCQGFRIRTRTCNDNRCVGPWTQQEGCYKDVACQGESGQYGQKLPGITKQPTTAYQLVRDVSKRNCSKATVRALGVDTVKSCDTIPWVVVFEYVDTNRNVRVPICSGVLLSSTKVLTTEQCVQRRELQASIEVVAGSYPYGSQSRAIDDVLVLPQTQENNVNTIAIVSVVEAFIDNACATPACLPDPSDVFDRNSRCMVSGWGIESYVVPKQRISNVSLLSTSMCRYIYSHLNPSQTIHDDTLCTDPSRHNVTVCEDDRGWMLACDDSEGRTTLLGLYSAVGRPACNPNTPSIFQAITSHMTWILQQLSPPSF